MFFPIEHIGKFEFKGCSSVKYYIDSIDYRGVGDFCCGVVYITKLCSSVEVVVFVVVFLKC